MHAIPHEIDPRYEGGNMQERDRLAQLADQGIIQIRPDPTIGSLVWVMPGPRAIHFAHELHISCRVLVERLIAARPPAPYMQKHGRGMKHAS